MMEVFPTLVVTQFGIQLLFNYFLIFLKRDENVTLYVIYYSDFVNNIVALIFTIISKARY